MQLLNKVRVIMGLTMASQMLKLDFVNQRIANRQLFMEPTDVDSWRMIVHTEQERDQPC